MKTCNQTTHDPYEIATRRAKAKLGFYIHFAVYFIVNTGQMFASFFSPEPFSYWSGVVGWAVGLAIHAFVVFVGADVYNYVQQWLLEDELQQLEKR
jgi:dipeptide/tripeptide permease